MLTVEREEERIEEVVSGESPYSGTPEIAPHSLRSLTLKGTRPNVTVGLPSDPFP